MQPVRLGIHNVRAISALDIHLRPFGALIAPNNAGKSTVLDAIRLFYGDLVWDLLRDLPWTGPQDDSWVEVEFELDDGEAEELSSHADGSTLLVRRYFPGSEQEEGYVAIIRGEPPIAWRSPAIGRCVYVPAAARLQDYTSLAMPSPLRDILDASAIGEQVEQAFDELRGNLSRLQDALRAPDSPAEFLSAGLSRVLRAWDLEPKIAVAELTTEAILRNHIELRLTSGDLDMPLSAQGSGVQRAIIIGLIQTAAELRGRAGYAKASDFRWIVFEEPELYLHPAQIASLARDLHELSTNRGTSVTITTHDPTMLATAADGMDTITRLRRSPAGITASSSPRRNINIALARIEERSRYAQASLSCFKRAAGPRSLDMRHARMSSELDGQRASAFFADQVIVVEGFSDLAFFNWLRARGVLDQIGQNIGVLDSFGKFELHRSATTLSMLQIPHVVIWDGDAHCKVGKELREATCRDEAAWEALCAAANDPEASTVGGIRLAGDLESWLGVTVEKANPWKAGNLVTELDDQFHLPGSPVKERAEALIAAITDLFRGRSMSAHLASPLFADCLFAPPFPVPSRNFAAELLQIQQSPPTACRCTP